MAISRSSIFSFETLSTTKPRFPAGAVAAGVVILTCELLLHVFEDRLPYPDSWGHPEVSVKAAQMALYGKHKEPPIDILILGPSHTSYGVSPKAMKQSCQGTSPSVYNGSLSGHTYTAIEFLYFRLYRPILNPRLIVFGVSPIIVNVHNLRMERNSLGFFDGPMPKALTSTGLKRTWRLFLARHFDLYRYRRWVSRSYVDEYGYHSLSGVYGKAERARLFSPAHPYQRIMHEFEFGGPSLKSMIRMFQQAKADGVIAVVLNMPFREDLLAISPNGKQDYQRYLQKMRSLCARYGCIWLDYQRDLSLQDKHFRDVDHLNASGAVVVSTRLGLDLAKLLRPS